MDKPKLQIRAVYLNQSSIFSMVMIENVQEHIETFNSQNNKLRHNLALQPKELDWWKSDFVQDSTLSTWGYE